MIPSVCRSTIEVEVPSAMRLLSCVTSSQLDLWIEASSLLLRFDLKCFFFIKLIVIAGPDDLEPSLSSSSLKLGDLKHCTAPLASLLFSLPVCCVLTAAITFVCSPLSLSFVPFVVCLPFLSALTPTAGTRWPVLPELCSVLGLLL